MERKNLKSLILISLVGLIALSTRLIGLTQFPPSLNWDEASLGYNAYSVLNTGHDEWGQKLPLLFRAFGDYKLPGYVYFSALPIKIFGLNELSVRLTSALAGSLVVLLVFLISRKISPKSLSTAFAASLLFSLAPWTWFLSRIALEANLCLLFLTLSFCAYVYRRYLIFSVFLGLSVWTYNSARVFVPILLFCLALTQLKKIKSIFIHHKAEIFVISLFVMPMLLQLGTSAGQARFNWLTLLDEGAINRIEQARNTTQLPPIVSKLIYNRPVEFSLSFANNYLNHFSPNFLFINGGSHYQFSIPGSGLLPLVSLPLVLIGLASIFKKSPKLTIFVAVWLLCAPVAGSLTRDAPHTLRAIPMLIPIIFFVIMGINRLPSLYKLGKPLLILILLCEFGLYFNKLSLYRTNFSWAWQYGQKELVQTIVNNYDKYDQFIVSKRYGEPHIFYYFYSQFDPNQVNNPQLITKYSKSNWFWTDRVDKVIYVDDWRMVDYVNNPENTSGKRLLIFDTPSNPVAATQLDSILYLNNAVAYTIKIK